MPLQAPKAWLARALFFGNTDLQNGQRLQDAMDGCACSVCYQLRITSYTALVLASSDVRLSVLLLEDAAGSWGSMRVPHMDVRRFCRRMYRVHACNVSHMPVCLLNSLLVIVSSSHGWGRLMAPMKCKLRQTRLQERECCGCLAATTASTCS